MLNKVLWSAFFAATEAMQISDEAGLSSESGITYTTVEYPGDDCCKFYSEKDYKGNVIT